MSKNNWRNANKTFPNVSKTEVGLFKSHKKQTDSDLQFKLNGSDTTQQIQWNNLETKLMKTLRTDIALLD